MPSLEALVSVAASARSSSQVCGGLVGIEAGGLEQILAIEQRARLDGDGRSPPMLGEIVIALVARPHLVLDLDVVRFVIGGEIVVERRERAGGLKLRHHIVAEHGDVRQAAAGERGDKSLLLRAPGHDFHVDGDVGVLRFERLDRGVPGVDVVLVGAELPEGDGVGREGSRGSRQEGGQTACGGEQSALSDHGFTPYRRSAAGIVRKFNRGRVYRSRPERGVSSPTRQRQPSFA